MEGTMTYLRSIAAVGMLATLTIGVRAADLPSDPGTLNSQAGAPRVGFVSAADVQLWHRFARAAIVRNKPSFQQEVRVLAYLSLAEHEAARAVYADDAIRSEAAISAAIARASSDTLVGFFASEASNAQSLLALERGGLAFSGGSDAESRGDAIGARTAQAILARAAADGFTLAWSGTAPTDPRAWRSQASPPQPPLYPQMGSMRTFFIARGDVLRSPPPPNQGSPEFDRALVELRELNTNPTPEHARIAKAWVPAVGNYWDEVATGLAAQHGLTGPETARVLALTMPAMMDAYIACHDAKYVYWLARPSQVDPSIKPIIPLPNHPSYPSNHACVSGAAGYVLAAVFPDSQDRILATAQEAAMSRLYGGIHYRFDMDAGLRIARGVADVTMMTAQTPPFAPYPKQ
jgi:hypothetical protein